MINAWNSIPPHLPTVLATYLGKLTRFVSLKRWRDLHRKKRGGSEICLIYEELSESISDRSTVEDELDTKEIGKIINSFLDSLPETEQRIFICRYWYFDCISDIGRQFGFTNSKVKSILYRMRQKLSIRLKEEGVNLEN